MTLNDVKQRWIVCSFVFKLERSGFRKKLAKAVLNLSTLEAYFKNSPYRKKKELNFFSFSQGLNLESP